MADFRLFCFRGGHIYHSDEFSAPDDNTAIQRALELCGDSPAELWSGTRKVTAFGAVEELAQQRG